MIRRDFLKLGSLVLCPSLEVLHGQVIEPEVHSQELEFYARKQWRERIHTGDWGGIEAPGFRYRDFVRKFVDGELPEIPEVVYQSFTTRVPNVVTSIGLVVNDEEVACCEGEPYIDGVTCAVRFSDPEVESWATERTVRIMPWEIVDFLPWVPRNTERWA